MTTLIQDLESLAADLVTTGKYEGAALVTAAVNAMAVPANMPASDAAILTDDERRALAKVKWSADNLSRTVSLSVEDIKALGAMADRLSAPQQPVAASSEPVFTLNARQLRSALDFIAPDFDADEDQRDAEISMQMMPDRMPLEDEPMPAGLYAWCTDYPEEGCIPLLEDETRFERPASTNQPVQAKALTDEQIKDAILLLDDCEVIDGNGVTQEAIAIVRALLASQPSAHPIEQEPAAWIRITDITELTDSEPETGGWTPLYAIPQPSTPAGMASVRDAAQRFMTIASTVRGEDESDLTAAQMTEFDRARHALALALKSAAPTAQPQADK
jgi:hypothetical protein